jgi:hypothetical protein
MEKVPRHPATVRSHGGLRRPLGCGEEDNAAHLGFNRWLQWVKGMEGGEAEVMASANGRWCGVARAGARRRRRGWRLGSLRFENEKEGGEGNEWGRLERQQRRSSCARQLAASPGRARRVEDTRRRSSAEAPRHAVSFD